MNLNCKNQNEIGLTNKDSKTEFYGINKKIEDILNTEEIIIKICEELLKSKNLITEKTENEIIKQISNKLNRNLNDAEKELVKNIISEKKEEIDKKHIKTRKNW